jgi:hypothetical protein
LVWPESCYLRGSVYGNEQEAARLLDRYLLAGEDHG